MAGVIFGVLIPPVSWDAGGIFVAHDRKSRPGPCIPAPPHKSIDDKLSIVDKRQNKMRACAPRRQT